MKQSRALAAALAGAPVLDEPARELLADVEAAVKSDPISWRDVTPAPLQGGESTSEICRTVRDLGDVALGFMRRM